MGTRGGGHLFVIDWVQQWVHHHRAVGWIAAAAFGLSVLSLVAGLGVVVALPANYFVRGPARHGFWQSHAVLRVTLLVAKNLLGVATFLAGFVMALPLVPGPGVLFMLVGLGLVDFPGKRSLERRLLRVPRVLSSVNKLRARFGKPAIMTEERHPRSVVDSGP
jgi:hypothetical protein